MPASRAPGLTRPSCGVSSSLHAQHQRQRLGDRKDGDPRRRAVIAEHEEAQAGEAQPGDQPGAAPGDRPVEEFLDAHRGEAERENQRGAGGQQRQQRVRHHPQHRERGAGGGDEGRAGPEPRGVERRIAAHHVGPDQAQREKVDDEHRPQRRNAQHREPGTRTVPSPLLSDRPKLALPRRFPQRQSPLSCGQGASAPLNGLSPRPSLIRTVVLN